MKSNREKTDPKEGYVFVKKAVLDEYICGAVQSERSVAWLRNERDRLLAENEEILQLSERVNKNARTLMEMFHQLEEENDRLHEENRRLRGSDEPQDVASTGMN